MKGRQRWSSVESLVWPDGSRNAALSTEAAQLVDCRQTLT